MRILLAALVWLSCAVAQAQSPIGSFPPGTFGSRAAVDAGAPAYDAASEAIFAAFTTPPDNARKTAINNVVVALKACDGGTATTAWADFEVLYMYWAFDRQSAGINWVNPGTFTITEVNIPGFTQDRGFTGGSGKVLDTGFNLSTASKYLQDSGHLSVWPLTAGTGGVAIGTDGANFTDYIHTHWGASETRGNINAPQFGNTSLSTSTKTGYFFMNRSGSGSMQISLDAGTQSTGSTTSQARSNVELTGLVTAGSFYFDGQISMMSAGASMNTTKITCAYNAFFAYGQAVGAIP